MDVRVLYVVSLVGIVCLSTAVGTDCWDSVWFNTNHPSLNNTDPDLQRGDIEPIPAGVFDRLKNGTCHGQRLKARCKDDTNASNAVFELVRNNTVAQYSVSCSIRFGVTCEPYENTSISVTCPDFAIQFGCKCPVNSTVLPVRATIGITVPIAGSIQTATTVPTTGNGGCNHGNSVMYQNAYVFMGFLIMSLCIATLNIDKVLFLL